MHILIQKLDANHNNNEEMIMNKKQDDFYKYMEHLQYIKIREKLEIGRKETIQRANMVRNVFNTNGSKIVKKNEETIVKKHDNKEYKRSCLLILYEKIYNFCFRSPLVPYSAKKHIWAGKNGKFKDIFQDNREFN